MILHAIVIFSRILRGLRTCRVCGGVKVKGYCLEHLLFQRDALRSKVELLWQSHPGIGQPEKSAKCKGARE